jgi:rhamnosyltransferase
MMHDVLAIIVCFHPDHAHVRRLIDAIAPTVGCIVLYDNGALDVAQLGPIAANLRVESPGGNMGLAKPLNFACDYGVQHGYRFLVSFDQDSTPPSDMIPLLRDELLAYQQRDPRAVAIGPQLVDVRDGKETVSPFVRFTTFGVEKWTGQGTEPVSQLITSGCMMDLNHWSADSRFKEPLFIDLVDNNWCWKMTRMNYRLLGTSRARMPHELSEEIRESRVMSLNKYGRVRRYFQMRNAVYHLFHESLSAAQRLYVARAMVVVFASSLMADERPMQALWQCLRGAVHGLAGRLGAYR